MCFLFDTKVCYLATATRHFKETRCILSNASSRRFRALTSENRRKFLPSAPNAAPAIAADACFFQQDFLDLLRARSGIFDIDPGIKSAGREIGSESREFWFRLETNRSPTLSIFGGHGVDSVGGITQGFDCGDLGKFCGAGERVEHEAYPSLRLHVLAQRRNRDASPSLPKLLENPSMMTVRSAIPGKAHGERYSPPKRIRA